LIAKSTVEERILAIQERRRGEQQALGGIAPEVFDAAILNDIFRSTP
jgi:hypothetical protein